ncbi:VOC family protein [Pseudochrobactrum asaccharolyticum]|uniref:Phospholipase/carboxylesterase n=2 Tax=Brucellaceae TaxID=118882 RepID=A0A366ECG4_9HYPH|nr:VOC family protein [Pseudochrobactrum asaccharolyticum]RBO99118.1 phospholipase/carboxylesterase [Pseudochrobactrum asaccharolyticum]
MTSGIHHVTLITRNVQANIDFYAGFLGLRLVKQTGGYEDGEQLHLFYGDAVGSPGSLITFLVWEEGARGRVGHGQVAEIALAVPPESIGDWLTCALSQHIQVEGPKREFGESVLRLKDPDGVIVKLVGHEMSTGHPWKSAPSRLHSVTLFTETQEETAAFVKRFGYSEGQREDSVLRMVSDTDFIDVRNVTGFVQGIPGTGIADHVAFRAKDVDAVKAAEAELSRLNSSVTNYHDRNYFTSLYVREPGGILIELATDGPGFTIDETPEHLGETLFVPPHDQERAQDLKVLMPQFAMPGEERIVMRDLPFVHRFYTPQDPDGSIMLLLHGTGGNEADLMPMAHRINPRATLLGVRGRSHEEGTARWFRRFGATQFDQADIRSEAEAFKAFYEGAIAAYGLKAENITVLGYSNGANFAAAVMALYPQLIRRAILSRPMQVLEDAPQVDLKGTAALTLTGSKDPFSEFAPALNTWLESCGVELTAEKLETGHALSPEDIARAKNWLSL